MDSRANVYRNPFFPLVHRRAAAMPDVEEFKSGKRLKSLDEFDQKPFKVIPEKRKELSTIQVILIGLALGSLIGFGLYEFW
jgi:hypothetical protein